MVGEAGNGVKRLYAYTIRNLDSSSVAGPDNSLIKVELTIMIQFIYTLPWHTKSRKSTAEVGGHY
jgi:hypothetical protein